MNRPEPSSQEVSRRLKAVRQRDTAAELALRSELHRRGLRFRVDKPIPGVTRARPDIVFPTERVAVFVDGCFWHSCPEHATLPTANREWWANKLSANQARDRRHDEELEAAGWCVVRVWEHRTAVDGADEVERALIDARTS